jgi:UDP-N-acetylglucosamine 2-epimerase (hydrolysing)
LSRKRILFVTGTRADYGKLKPLMAAVKDAPDFEYRIFGTGMHNLAKYGNTIVEIEKSGFDNLFTFMNQVDGEDPEVILANTIAGLSRFLHENPVDLIVVHGDRLEALAGATVGAFRNIRVAHVEGGEVSGTVDELIRHAVSKLSHIHFVANDIAKKRLLQLGEVEESIIVIGSPDIDVMLSEGLPTLSEALDHYEVPFRDFAIGMLHPVTTERNQQRANAEIFVQALIESDDNFVIVYPNNDAGSDEILEVLTSLQGNSRFKIFPSLRFEFYLVLLRNAQYIVGNSSSGIHEAPVYGLPTINIGTRQNNRSQHESILNVPFDLAAIQQGIDRAKCAGRFSSSFHFGRGDSARRFLETLRGSIWRLPNQKLFRDLSPADVQG